MVMTVWDPLAERLSLRDAMNRLFEQAVLQPEGQSSAHAGTLAPLLDVSETPEAYIVRTNLPGVRPDDVTIQLHQGVLTISGEFRDEAPRPEGEQAQSQAYQSTSQTGQGQQRHVYHVRERRQGRFFRSLTLPAQVDPDGAQANFEHGVLTLTIPKVEEAKPRRIEIGSGAGKQQSQPHIEASASGSGASSVSESSGQSSGARASRSGSGSSSVSSRR